MDLYTELSVSWMRKLKYSGFPAVTRVIYDTLVEFDEKMAEPHFTDKLKRLDAWLPTVDLIKHTVRKQEITKSLSKLRKSRAKLVSEIKNKIRSSKGSNFEDDAENASFLYDWIAGRAPNISNGAQFEISDYVRILLDDLVKDAKIGASVVALNLNKLFTALSEVQDQYTSLYNERGLDWGTKASPLVDVVSIRRYTLQEIQSLYNTISDMVRINGLEDNIEMILSLKKNLEPFRSTVKVRQTIRKSEINPNGGTDKSPKEENRSSSNTGDNGNIQKKLAQRVVLQPKN